MSLAEFADLTRSRGAIPAAQKNHRGINSSEVHFHIGFASVPAGVARRSGAALGGRCAIITWPAKSRLRRCPHVPRRPACPSERGGARAGHRRIFFKATPCRLG